MPRPQMRSITAAAPSPAAQATTAAVDASLKAVMEKLVAKGPEYEALAELARPIIEAVVWEIVPQFYS